MLCRQQEVILRLNKFAQRKFKQVHIVASLPPCHSCTVWITAAKIIIRLVMTCIIQITFFFSEQVKKEWFPFSTFVFYVRRPVNLYLKQAFPFLNVFQRMAFSIVYPKQFMIIFMIPLYDYLQYKSVCRGRSKKVLFLSSL